MKGGKPSDVCLYCTNPPRLYLYSNNFTRRMEIDSLNHGVSLWHGSEWIADFQINHCPVCGRKFGEDNPSRD